VSIAIDATGDVYIVDQGNSRTIEEIFSAGSYTEHLVTLAPFPPRLPSMAAGTFISLNHSMTGSGRKLPPAEPIP
jgi:hypothetical protein